MSDPRWMRQRGRFGYWVPGNGEVAWIDKATIYGANDAIVEQAIADAEAAVRDAARVPELEAAGNALADELTNWGWGDFHYGQQTEQELSVVQAIARWREAANP